MSGSQRASNDVFATTAWSVILRAQGSSAQSDPRQRCLEHLAAVYWTPVYAFVRRRTPNEDDALELTQAYFQRFLEKNVLDQVSPTKGRFRAFLLASVKHFLANAADHRQARKRAPEGRMLSLNIDADSARAVAAEPASPDEPPDAAFMKEWARATVRRALARMREDCARNSSLDYCRVLELHTLSGEEPNYAETAKALGWSLEKVRKTLHRARKRFGDALRATVRESVDSDAEVEEELADLRCYFS